VSCRIPPGARARAPRRLNCRPSCTTCYASHESVSPFAAPPARLCVMFIALMNISPCGYPPLPIGLVLRERSQSSMPSRRQSFPLCSFSPPPATCARPAAPRGRLCVERRILNRAPRWEASCAPLCALRVEPGELIEDRFGLCAMIAFITDHVTHAPAAVRVFGGFSAHPLPVDHDTMLRVYSPAPTASLPAISSTPLPLPLHLSSASKPR